MKQPISNKILQAKPPRKQTKTPAMQDFIRRNALPPPQPVRYMTAEEVISEWGRV